MANTFYTETEYFEDAIVSFESKLAPIMALSTKFEGEINGATVTVPLASTGAGQEYVNTYAVDNSVLAAIEVPVKHMFKSFSINVGDASKSAAAQLKNLYKTNLDALMASIHTSAFAGLSAITEEVDVALSSFGWADVKTALEAGEDLPEDGKTMILKSAYNTALLPSAGDNLLIKAEDYDLTKFVSNKLPVNGVITHPGAYAIATALPSNPLVGTSALIDFEIIEVDGMQILYTVSGDGNTGTIRGTFAVLVGGKLAQDKSVKFV